MEEQTNGHAEEPIKLWVSSLVSHRTGEGLVQFEWNDKKGQCTPQEARKIASDLLECAEAAESDEIAFKFGKTELEDENAGIALLAYFRRERERIRQERPRPKDLNDGK